MWWCARKSNEFTVPCDNATVGLNCCATFFGYTINDISSRVSPPRSADNSEGAVVSSQSFNDKSKLLRQAFQRSVEELLKSDLIRLGWIGYTQYRIVNSKTDKQYGRCSVTGWIING